MSNDDIGKGTLWFNEISTTLSSSSVGVVFLTRENLSSPWILFEAEALANGLSAKRVCTVLVDIKPSDVKDPLAQFNHTLLSSQQEMKKLVNTINASLGESGLPSDVLSQVFDTYWPSYQADIKKLLSQTESRAPENDSPVRSELDMIGEILEVTRNMERRLNRVEGESRRLSLDKDKNENFIDYNSSILPGSIVRKHRVHIESLKKLVDDSKDDIE